MADHFVIRIVSDEWKRQGLPSKVSLSIAIGYSSVTHDGAIVISPVLSSDTEVDATVDRLIEDLNLVRAEAKGALRAKNLESL